MNTTAGIKKTCGSLYTFPLVSLKVYYVFSCWLFDPHNKLLLKFYNLQYARCLSKNFKAEGLDMGEAVTKVNVSILTLVEIFDYPSIDYLKITNVYYILSPKIFFYL